jgi:putative N6-adenine-specific DNA methylase
MIEPNLFLTCPPGLEPQLLEEAREIGLPGPRAVEGGVEAQGGWEGVRRANLRARIATRVLARLAAFPAPGFPALIAGLREVPWADHLPARLPVRIDASARGSRAAHGGAVARHAAEALERAGLRPGRGGEAEALRLVVRLDRDICTVSLDPSGAPLHLRGFRTRIGPAPLRETLAAGFLRAAGFRGGEPVLDPMCGAGTLPIEAAEIDAGLRPGRARPFAFERLPSHDAARWAALRASDAAAASGGRAEMRGADRDAGAIRMATANAEASGVAARCTFAQAPISALAPPGGPPGLLIVNPPYGARLGRGDPLQGLYAALGRAAGGLGGWRVALIASDDRLARATGLGLAPGPWVPHGGLRVRLWQGRL